MQIFSGIQPSGEFHLGNYLGAMKNWVKLQEENDCIFSIVDLHAITVDYDPIKLSERIISATKDALAVGIDPEKSVLFLQSDIKEHAELAWLLNNIAKIGDLTKMHQFKNKTGADFEELEKAFDNSSYMEPSEELKKAIEGRDPHEIQRVATYTSFKTAHHFFQGLKEKFNKSTAGYFNYPVLMAADILLYKAEGVPVGEDQVQHVELTRDLASRFNNKFGQTFSIPKPILTETKRVMSLDGQGKMSKSNAPSTYIALSDTPEIIRKKISSATTDSGNEPEISNATKNLFGLMEVFAGVERAEFYMSQRRAGTIKYSEFKPELAEAIIRELEPIQARRAEISDDQVRQILKAGAAKIQDQAQKNIQEIKEKMGLKI